MRFQVETIILKGPEAPEYKEIEVDRIGDPVFLALVVDDEKEKRQSFLRNFVIQTGTKLRGTVSHPRSLKIVASDIDPLQQSMEASRSLFVDFLSRFDVIYMDEDLKNYRRGSQLLEAFYNFDRSSWTQRILYSGRVPEEILKWISPGGLFDRSRPIQAVVERSQGGTTNIGLCADIAIRCFEYKRKYLIPDVQKAFSDTADSEEFARLIRGKGITINQCQYAAEEVFPEICGLTDDREIARVLERFRIRPNLSASFSKFLNRHGIAQITHSDAHTQVNGHGFIASAKELKDTCLEQLKGLGEAISMASGVAPFVTKDCEQRLARLRNVIEQIDSAAWESGATTEHPDFVARTREELFQRHWDDKLLRPYACATKYSTDFVVYFPIELLKDELINLITTLTRKNNPARNVTGRIWWAFGGNKWGKEGHPDPQSGIWQDVDLLCIFQENHLKVTVLDPIGDDPPKLALCLRDKLPATKLFGEVYVVSFGEGGYVFDAHLMEQVRNEALLPFNVANLKNMIEWTDAKEAKTTIVCAFANCRDCGTDQFAYNDGKFVAKESQMRHMPA